ncbi:chemotaxis protein [Shewanella sp. WXL01]|uniref:Chemotaxis protein n=1 Tax=Shewanella maritima TaxID=2520507 RepID=A0A411PME8_9GAMM|nr:MULTISPECIES: chemotaxis protein [Shewanella]NKF52606.1 chemotaxis protein [Shewanella sp. WXL01]QBF84717.1 chemotaxis protein [Shewanella maritima]
MQIPSASASGLQALQSAQQGLAQATTTVAQPDPKPQPEATESQSLKSDTVTLSSQAQDKTSALIDATQAGHQGEVATRVIEAENETVGSLINISV